MFLINSRLGLATATQISAKKIIMAPTQALLLPKLRSHFAEFLKRGYPARLGILYPPTCVGLRYGHLVTSIEVFLGSVGSATSGNLLPSLSPLGLTLRRICLPQQPYQLSPGLPTPSKPTLLRHSFSNNGYKVGPEYEPAVHRLRLATSA